MEKLRLREVVLVEGKYDAAKLSDLLDTLILTTNGFSLFTDRDKQQLIRDLARRRGLIILTDSDAAGFQIRRFVNDLAGDIPVKNLYIPSVPGKESRKARPGKEGLLGVEGIDAERLRELFSRQGVACEAPRAGEPLTYADLYELGVSGTPGAAETRRRLLARAGLPLRLGKRAMLEVLNSLYTREEFFALCQNLDDPHPQI